MIESAAPALLRGAVIVEALIASMGVSACGPEGGGGAGGEGGAAGGSGGACLPCSAATALAVPGNDALDEVSGLVASVTHPGVYYAHNDSGDTARFFALDDEGKDHGSFVLEGRTAIDFEDVASGPCADSSATCLYLGDIGDNDESRSDYAIYRVAEPAETTPGIRTVASERFPFEYPDGSYDSEAMFVDPASGAVVMITKGKKHARAFVYRPPLRADVRVTLEALGDVDVPEEVPTVTGASIRHDGSAVLLRTPTSVWLYAASAGFESALGKAPCPLPAPPEAQPEAIAWLLDDSGFRSIGEGSGEPLFAVDCRPTADSP